MGKEIVTNKTITTMYYIIFTTEDRQVFVSKEGDLTHPGMCVNFAEGTSRAPVFQSERDARKRCDQLKRYLDELKEDDENELYRFASLHVCSSEEINKRNKDEALYLGGLGDFIDVEIKGNDVILARDNRVYNDEDSDDEEEYQPSIHASIVDGILYIKKEFDTGNGYEDRIVWVSNQFTITIKESGAVNS